MTLRSPLLSAGRAMKKTSCRRLEGWNARRKVGAGKGMRVRICDRRKACFGVDSIRGESRSRERPATMPRIIAKGGIASV